MKIIFASIIFLLIIPFVVRHLGGDYMISVSRDEILSRFAGIPAVL